MHFLGFGHLEIPQPVVQQGQSFEFGLKRLPEHLPKVGNSPRTALPTPTEVSDQLNDQVLEVEIKMADNVDETKLADDENKTADNANKMVDFVSKMVDDETEMKDIETKMATGSTNTAEGNLTTDDDQNLQKDGSKHVGNGEAMLADAKYLDIEMTDSVIVTDEYDVK